jgi:hypothetical protein
MAIIGSTIVIISSRCCRADTAAAAASRQRPPFPTRFLETKSLQRKHRHEGVIEIQNKPPLGPTQPPLIGTVETDVVQYNTRGVGVLTFGCSPPSV